MSAVCLAVVVLIPLSFTLTGNSFMLGMFIGLLVTLSCFVKSSELMHENYTCVQQLLRTTTMAQVILSESFQQRVLEDINSRSFFAVTPPQGLEQEIRFAARYWHRLTRLAFPADELPRLKRRQELFGDFARHTRCRAICDFLIHRVKVAKSDEVPRPG